MKLDLSGVETKTCPKCGADMIKRNGKYGEFWGCSNYPDCNCIISGWQGPDDDMLLPEYKLKVPDKYVDETEIPWTEADWEVSGWITKKDL